MDLLIKHDETDEGAYALHVRLFIGCLVGWYDVILTCLQVIIICELI